MMSTNGDYRFISGDSHIYEPVDLWTNRMDGKYRRVQIRLNNDIQAKLDYRSGYFGQR